MYLNMVALYFTVLALTYLRKYRQYKVIIWGRVRFRVRVIIST